jgi:hypothetical protein
MSTTGAKSKTAGAHDDDDALVSAGAVEVSRLHHVHDRCRRSTVPAFRGEDNDDLAKVDETIKQLYGKMGFCKKRGKTLAVLVVKPSHLPFGSARDAFVAQVCRACTIVCVYGYHLLGLDLTN